MNPTVSVVMPCYNAERWVAGAVESALLQTGFELEVIAVNDGSKDGTLSVLRSLEGPRVTILDQVNRGASAARNAGLKAARGEYIQFLDADDLLAAGKIGAQLKLLGAQDEGTVSTAKWARFREDPTAAIVTDSPLFADLGPVEFLILHVAQGQMMHPAAWLVPAAIARAAGPWNEDLTLNDDGEYFSRVVLASKGIVHARDSLSLYRSGLASSLSGRADRRALESLFLSCELVAGHLRKAEDSPRVRRALADYFQRLTFETYPGAPDLSRRAEVLSRSLGESTLQPLMGGRQALFARLLGWRLVRRLADFAKP
jgi:glycosyltransferase involved in cell wall biosynthesis